MIEALKPSDPIARAEKMIMRMVDSFDGWFLISWDTLSLLLGGPSDATVMLFSASFLVSGCDICVISIDSSSIDMIS